MTKILLFLAVLLVAGQVTAAEWLFDCNANISGVRSLDPGQTACSNPTGITDDTPIISLSNCENFDVHVYDDADGNGTGSASLTYTLKVCPDPHGTFATDAIEDLACPTFSSGGSITGSGQTLGAAAPFFKVTMGGTFTSSSDPRILIQCNE